MKNLSLFLALLIIGLGCQADTSTKGSKAITSVKKLNGDYSEIIRIEDSILNDFADTASMARMTFDQTIFDFGTVDEGDIVNHTFFYRNTGKKPLLLRVAHSTCGCTVPDYNSDIPLPPGGRDSIVVTFNTTNKPNLQNKAITVIANSYPNKVLLYLRGYVNEKN